MVFEIYEENNAYPLKNLCCVMFFFSPYVQFNFCNKNNSYFLSCLNPSSKIEKGSRSNICNFIGY